MEKLKDACVGLRDDEVELVLAEITRIKAEGLSVENSIIGLVRHQMQGLSRKATNQGDRIIDLEDSLRNMLRRYELYLTKFGLDLELSQRESYSGHREVLFM